ncbi:carboxypeptidase-like regulatory domain-containing protein [Sphingobacterium sp. T2]|uniref:carboxypeptidase-like regulatory domain-containing protein n=1 Tax=Sphingobacterium sp. T2 TaxID=1590596 RepID=UPI001E498823|nr:carboxypeptidase-like regulatory domain-containing protein [Sphingobacterium sp. T2]
MRKLVLFSLALGMSLPTYSFVKVNKDKDRIQKTSDSYRKVDQEVVQGKVTSKSGPLPGATVSVVGGESTQTDAEGNYSVKAKVGATLRVSMVGYATKEVIVTGTTVNIDLDEQGTALDEVVVVGYGTQRRGNLTGAVSTVNIKDNLEGRTVVDVGRAIQGTTPGLNITILVER